MRFNLFLLLLVFCAKEGQAQFDLAQPYATVVAFFEAFHQKDQSLLEAAFHEEATLQSTRVNASGITVLRTVNISDFIQGVVQRSQAPVWEEKLGSPSILLDVPMAQVWVPYQFLLDGKLSHCGVNNFTLLWQDGRWKILQIIDTRQAECNDLY